MPVELPIDRRFVFSGSAVAFGGRLRRPDDVFLKTAAAVNLPVTGGLSEAHITGDDVKQYHYKDYLKFSEAHSRAQGDYSDPRKAAEYTHGNHGQNPLPAVTTVESCLLGLSIDAEPDATEKTPRRIFSAEKLQVHMQTTTGTQETTIRSFSAAFEGISIAGEDLAPFPVVVQTATDIFGDNESKAKLMARFAADADFREKYATCFHPLGEPKKNMLANLISKHEIPNADRGPIVATFVTGLQFPHGLPDGVEALNNRLTIRGLGRVYFGEIIINDHSQRATLLRFELGSGIGGGASAGEASSNGGHVPPQG